MSTRRFRTTLSYLWGLCSHDPENYGGGSVASGSASHAGQVSGDDTDKEGITSSFRFWVEERG